MNLTFDEANTKLKSIGYCLKLDKKHNCIDVINRSHDYEVASIALTGLDDKSFGFAKYTIEVPISKGWLSKKAVGIINNYAKSLHKGAMPNKRNQFLTRLNQKQIWNENEIGRYCDLISDDLMNATFVARHQKDHKNQEKYFHNYNMARDLATLANSSRDKQEYKNRTKLIVYKQSIKDGSIFKFVSKHFEPLQKHVLNIVHESKDVKDLDRNSTKIDRIYNQLRAKASEFSKQDYLESQSHK